MIPSALPLFLVLAGIAFAFWIYFRQELPVRGRGLLAGVRGAIFALLLLLLWNPSVPGRSLTDASGPRMILLDASLSMMARDTSGAVAWDLAVERVRSLEREGEGEPGSTRLVLFGDGFDVFDSGDAAGRRTALDEREADFVRSELAPALARAAEVGARAVTVVSDLRLHDAVAAREVIDRLQLDVRIERVGEVVRNVGIGEFELPRGVEAGDTVPAEVVLFGESPVPGDSLTLEIREEGRLVATRRLPLPEPGRATRVTLALPSPRGSGLIEYRATALLEEDGFTLDDERVAHLVVDPDEGGIVLLSWRPDWEPRFLLPVLERVTGLSILGVLRTGESRYLEMGAGPSAGGAMDEDALRRRMARADLLVLHGIDGEVPTWLREIAAGSSRLLLFPRDREGAAIGGVATLRNPLSGEWYPGTDLPPSPIAAALSGMELSSLPPLSRLFPMEREEEGAVPLQLQLQGRGPFEAAIVLRADGPRRRAVALASGYWRWGFREGPPRQSYRRLWAGVGGWLLGNEPIAGGPGVRPESSILPRGVDIDWRAQGLAGEALAVRVLREDSVALDTLVSVGDDSGFRTPSLPPGRYRYVVRGEGAQGEPPGSDGTPEVGAGVFEVEVFTDELAVLPRDIAGDAMVAGAGEGPGDVVGAEDRVPVNPLPSPAADGGPPGSETSAREGGAAAEAPVRGAERERRPLRTHPAPFLLLLALLCGEWIGRRGKGLR